MDSYPYFLKVSGSISTGKHREFQQTIQFIFNHLPPGCLTHNLALDVFNTNLYHLYCTWQSEGSLAAFKNSYEYQLLKGSFQTLGDHHATTSGPLADLQLFEVQQNDP